MIEVRQTADFERWLQKLRDREARARILVRIRRLSLGNFGDAKSVGQGVYELRLHYGPGYRIYYLHQGETVVLLLCGGTKNRQSLDIERAMHLAKEV